MTAIEPTMSEILAARLKELRAKAGLTQAQLAEKVGLSTSHLAQIERLERAPSLSVLDTFAKALGVAPGDLLSVPNVYADAPRYLVQFLEWMRDEEINYDEVCVLRRAAKLLVQRRTSG
jgi:transcriptional regulator with XRE-family HTH domain